MAKKKNDGFDPDGFIESVRPSSVPTYHTASDISGQPQQPQQETTGLAGVYDDYDTDNHTKYENLNMTDDEIDFIKTFIANGRFRRVSRHGRQVFIRERHLSMISNILRLLDEEANISTYIDNVLTQHFKKHYSVIQGISKKCPSKF